ncbi:acylphosphatase [Lentibacillus jeotgali]|uniref:ATP-binding protein n=1 Tax=Lentibacillus jeotgali TaxID=558169 RepID=UPI0002626487|nr:acylphosphatase [Lentibacillus jeotgali]
MENYKNTWLPHLKDAVPKAAQGKGTCMYTVALEGWRRGLELRFIKKKGSGLLRSVSFSLSDGRTKHVFSGSRGDYVSREAKEICRDKGLTNQYLEKAGVPTPGGKFFDKGTAFKTMISYAKRLGFPVVVKPSDSDGGGAGVKTNIRNENELEEVLKKVRANERSIIIERFFTGDDFRVYVLEDKVIGAFQRRAASVVGDGKSDISTLLEQKNKERQKSPFLSSSNIKIDRSMENFLQEKGLASSHVPKKGERVFLRRNGEYFGQRDSVNVTDDLSQKMKDIAISAVNAIPGLPHAGVDMLINLDTNEGVVNEVNSRAQISNHVFPIEGKAIDIPKHIIDYYFPETKNDKATDVKYIFDFKTVVNSFEAGTAKEIKIPSIPAGLKTVRRYVVTGSNFNKKYHKWLQRKALEKNLDGYVRTIDKNSISVVVAGSEYVVKSFKDVIKKSSPKSANVTNVNGMMFNKPVKVGFELRQNAGSKNNNKTRKKTSQQKPAQQKKKEQKKQFFVFRVIKLPISVLRKIKRKIV